MPVILVDADSMMSRLRAIILRRAVRENLRAVFVADRRLDDVLQAAREHTTALRDPYRGKLDEKELRAIRSGIRMIVVQGGTNAADDRIAELADEDSIVISHDIPLLARVLEKGAAALDDRGHIYTKENIGERLARRNVNSMLREMMVFEERTRSQNLKSAELFANAFDSVLRKK